MSTGASLKTIVDAQDKLRQLLDRKAVQALNILGAVTKKEASQSIRRRKRPSKPGEPPSSPTGRLKRTIQYAIEREAKTVVIGPVKTAPGSTPMILEYGGTSEIDTPQAVLDDYGPIRWSRSSKQLGGRRQWSRRVYLNGKYTSVVEARVKLKTQKMVDRANRIFHEMYGAAGRKIPIRIAPRPYMRRAFNVILPKAQQIIASKIQE